MDEGRRRMKLTERRIGLWGSFVLALSLVLVSCAPDTAPAPEGEQTTTTGAPATTGASDTTQATAGEPFTVGYVTDLSGVFRDLFGPTLEGFQLYVENLNAQGGVDGHPIEVVVRDDEASPEQAVTGALELVTREGVSAIFGLSGTNTHQPVYDAMAEEGVPVVSGFSGIDAPLPPDPQPYAYSAGVVAPIIGGMGGQFIASTVLTDGTLTCTAIETPGGIAACDASVAEAEAGGLTVTGSVPFPPTAADYAPIAQDVIGGSPDAVIGQYGSSMHLRMIVALRGAGFQGPYVATPWGTSEASLKEAVESSEEGEGVYFYTRYASVDEEGVAGLEELAAAAEEFGTDFPIQNTHVQGWALARIAHAVFQECGFPCGPEDFNTTLESLEVEMEGLTGGPIQFTAEDHYGPTWWRLYQLNTGSSLFEPASDWTMGG
jgi:branched-chain amino acid transport system substrate-binding protein